MEAKLTPFTDAIVVQTCKDVGMGQELKVWLSHDLLSLLEIPFLLPPNILSHQMYRCCQCGTSFSQPNPLKIHIAFDCQGKERVVEALLPTLSFGDSAAKTASILVNGQSQIRGKERVPTKEPKTHVCVYCGKLYTRKYGLKIHLRTHTGHKVCVWTLLVQGIL